MKGHVPDYYLIEELLNSMNYYKNIFIITDEKGNKIQRVHTWEDPYPPMYFKPEEKDKDKVIEIDKKNSSIKLKEKKKIIVYSK